MEKEFDVFGIGSPLIDIFFEAEDKTLSELKLNKGSMHLINNVQFSDIQSRFNNPPIKTSIAGDVVNTMMGVSAMGGKSLFCGKVGNGNYADYFEEVLLSENIKPVLSRSNKYETGRVISFVTEDAERTMTTYLGAAVGLKKEEAVFDDIKKSKFLYTSGYVLDSYQLKETVLQAMKIAKDNGVKIAFDLADSGVISRHRKLINTIFKDYVDIILANEIEAQEFSGKMPKEALKEISKYCDIAIVKLGEKGSLIKKGEHIFNIVINKESPIDTTGAGDMYAAGFLFGLSRTNNIKTAADIASFASAKIVKQYGAKLDIPIKDKVENILKSEILVKNILKK